MNETEKEKYIERDRTFPVKFYGTSYVIVLDKQLRKLLKITKKDVESGRVGLRVRELEKVQLYQKQTEIIEF